MDNKYVGMTVNERLYVSGLSAAFYRAVDEKDANSANSILEKIGLPEASIKPILDSLGIMS